MNFGKQTNTILELLPNSRDGVVSNVRLTYSFFLPEIESRLALRQAHGTEKKKR